jgi:hypothetical protein
MEGTILLISPSYITQFAPANHGVAAVWNKKRAYDERMEREKQKYTYTVYDDTLLF